MKRIVVIDDEEILIRSFAKLLEKNGFEVFGFKKGADAIAFSEEEEILYFEAVFSNPIFLISSFI